MSKKEKHKIDLAYLREQTLGSCYKFKTPFGERLMTYADYIASGRNLRFIELYLLRIQEAYANTHTEDDITGKSTTMLLHKAEESIKKAVNGNEHTRLIAVGTGATGAIHKFQEIIGVALSPSTKALISSMLEKFSTVELSGESRTAYDQIAVEFMEYFARKRPVVFVGPYEHHSNEVTWRECLAEVIEVRLTRDGELDLAHLKDLVSRPEYEDRLIIGSFSAASNVTGLRTPVYDVARIIHKHGGIVSFDFAACAPYVEIDMNRDSESYFDAIFISPHKFLGGPGSSGLLIFNDEIYRKDLPPTVGGGGTVDYVSPHGHDYVTDIEEREKAGTPGTLQVLKAALALEVKDAIGVNTIERIELKHIRRALERFNNHERIIVLGNPAPEKRISIVSFNIRHEDKILHPKFVTRLLNDLFGIQSRAGCSCAGPYGHALLKIDRKLSDKYRRQILKGYNGIKPGWVRVGFHFTLDEEDVEFMCRAIEFIADHGHLFLPLYSFDQMSGTWSHVNEPDDEPIFSLERAIKCSESFQAEGITCERSREYESYFAEAQKLVDELKGTEHHYKRLGKDQEELRFFNAINMS